MMTTERKTINSLEWHQLPADAGQIVSVTYAIDEYYLYCRTHDRSYNSVKIERAEYTGDDEFDFQPWNGRLPTTSGEWEELE